MHLLNASTAAVDDGQEPVDLGQTPGDIVILSMADTELSLLAEAFDSSDLADCTLRLANAAKLVHNYSVDLYVETIIANARCVIVRLLGGRAYWPYGVDRLVAMCREKAVPLALLPGDDSEDPELRELSTVGEDAFTAIWSHLGYGGLENAQRCLQWAAHIVDADRFPRPEDPLPVMRAGVYEAQHRLDQAHARHRPVVMLIFYRALVQSGNLAPVDALAEALEARGLTCVPFYVQGLKDAQSVQALKLALADRSPALILNATGFAASRPGDPVTSNPLAQADCPILQVLFSGGSEEAWLDGVHGLSPRDLAMNVVLPEVDGRIFSRAVSFKSLALRHEATQCPLVRYAPRRDRIDFVADLASNWVKLARTQPRARRVAIVLANYPASDGRLANGVGLDVPASVHRFLLAMESVGYQVGTLPANAQLLLQELAKGVTNELEGRCDRLIREVYALEDYRRQFAELPNDVQTKITERWGEPDKDPHIVGDSFALSVMTLGHVVIGLQPARGYHIDPDASYHDPDLVPPHGYLAFYFWLRTAFGAHAIIHFGKHGNLEWLPGKSLALSEDCFPEAVFGPTPQFYPFIVNDPGEGTQAKRRTSAVVIDHMTPPLARAETYGELAGLERQLDEFYQALGTDPRRAEYLRKDILASIGHLGLDRDLGLSEATDEDSLLTAVDAHLCTVKELQIRDGLHIFGGVPDGPAFAALLIALLRQTRGQGEADHERSLLRALALDLDLEFDPLNPEMGPVWCGNRPEVLKQITDDHWRTHGDTVERLELLALALISGRMRPEPVWTKTRCVLDLAARALADDLVSCADYELLGLLRGLDGRFVPSGPSGAPTRGRADVLPTGRNFFSVDTRAVPTPTAWQLGWKAASLIVEKHLQDHGEWPTHVLLTAWGTSNMRTGGEDLAQALALMGAKPVWDATSGRVTGIEILPLSVMDRPRVDVTLRISGFFRDAFPAQMDLFNTAVQKIAERADESDEDNPLKARSAQEAATLIASGMSAEQATQQARFRIFGAKPGSYGAGLQALIDERGWQDEGDLAKAWVAWGGYAYGKAGEGQAAFASLEERLSHIRLVLHNQDNREHDILDSDDYYQFEGGAVAAIRHVSGTTPHVFHSDHSRPDYPMIRTLQEEIGLIVRGRAANPKWIRGVMRHGYKGAFEIAATLDYLFAYAATTRMVEEHHFDALYAAYVDDDEVRDFIEAYNPAALRDMLSRFEEAIERGLWEPRRNHIHTDLAHHRQKGVTIAS